MDFPEAARPVPAFRLRPMKSQAGRRVPDKLGQSLEIFSESDSGVCPWKHISKAGRPISRKERERAPAHVCHAKARCSGTVVGDARVDNQSTAAAGLGDPKAK